MTRLGIDIGSTTTKLILIDNDEIVYYKYKRHLSQVCQTTLEMLAEMQNCIKIDKLKVTISGSAGMGVAELLKINFIQEVYAIGEVVSALAPDTNVVIELGGPLYYCKGLRNQFYKTLNLTPETAVFPEYALYSVAMGAAMYAKNTEDISFNNLIKTLKHSTSDISHTNNRLAPLFENDKEYSDFCARHTLAAVKQKDISLYFGNAWLGIDCGSTTTKVVLIGEDKSILYTYYSSNKGNPVSLIKEQLEKIYNLCGDKVRICGIALCMLFLC